MFDRGFDGKGFGKKIKAHSRSFSHRFVFERDAGHAGRDLLDSGFLVLSIAEHFDAFFLSLDVKGLGNPGSPQSFTGNFELPPGHRDRRLQRNLDGFFVVYYWKHYSDQLLSKKQTTLDLAGVTVINDTLFISGD